MDEEVEADVATDEVWAAAAACTAAQRPLSWSGVRGGELGSQGLSSLDMSFLWIRNPLGIVGRSLD